MREVGGAGGPEGLFEWGCAHGRFQPFHNEHLEYVLAARRSCRRLIVGITNPDPGWVREEEHSEHRHRPEANPFPFFERVQMIRGALDHAGVDGGSITFVPFPIHEPGLVRYYVPKGTVHFVRIFSPWEQEKLRRLKEHGWRVVQLDPGKVKSISGSRVRELLRSGGPWEPLVPAPVARYLKELLGSDPDRLQGHS